MPQIGLGTILLYVFAMLWLALWRGRTRLWGLALALPALMMMLTTVAPDVLVARDGRQIAVTNSDGRLIVLREGEGYALDSLREAAAVDGRTVALENAPGARCSADFCALEVTRRGRSWSLLVARSKHYVDPLQLIAACANADIVIAARTMPRSCAPRVLKADRRFLVENGGLALSFRPEPHLTTVAESQGQHGWWQADKMSPVDRRAPPHPKLSVERRPPIQPHPIS